jgi:hypothetical protein
MGFFTFDSLYSLLHKRSLSVSFLSSKHGLQPALLSGCKFKVAMAFLYPEAPRAEAAWRLVLLTPQIMWGSWE